MVELVVQCRAVYKLGVMEGVEYKDSTKLAKVVHITQVHLSGCTGLDKNHLLEDMILQLDLDMVIIKDNQLIVASIMAAVRVSLAFLITITLVA